MHKTAFALTMFAISASAADFRALDIGQSCASAAKWEAAQGSTSMPGKAGPGADIYTFEGREFDRDVYLSYFCTHGTLFTGNYSFPIESLDQAVDSYREIRERLLSVYGDASSDASPWSGEGDVRSTGIDSPKYMTVWRTRRASTTLSLMRNQPSEKPGWRVFLVVGPVTSKATSRSAPPDERGCLNGSHFGGWRLPFAGPPHRAINRSVFVDEAPRAKRARTYCGRSNIEV